MTTETKVCPNCNEAVCALAYCDGCDEEICAVCRDEHNGEPDEQEEDYEGEARLQRWERAREEWWA